MGLLGLRVIRVGWGPALLLGFFGGRGLVRVLLQWGQEGMLLDVVLGAVEGPVMGMNEGRASPEYVIPGKEGQRCL